MGWDAQKPFANRPVTGVSWFEAMAYCAWLDARLRGSDQTGFSLPEGHRIRLPTEAEWEKAARHADARRFPWGDADWDESRANISDSGIERATAVGMYPLGATPAGVHDAAGNVWEWTLSDYGEYPYSPLGRLAVDPEPLPRVVRGGSWYGIRRLARCAYRLRYLPDLFRYGLGFRVVVSLADSVF
jgi:formylglycine-generating enzyme required for sulfatase activity